MHNKDVGGLTYFAKRLLPRLQQQAFRPISPGDRSLFQLSEVLIEAVRELAQLYTCFVHQAHAAFFSGFILAAA